MKASKMITLCYCRFPIVPNWGSADVSLRCKRSINGYNITRHGTELGSYAGRRNADASPRPGPAKKKFSPPVTTFLLKLNMSTIL
jgi:hypothetical protein